MHNLHRHNIRCQGALHDILYADVTNYANVRLYVQTLSVTG